MPTSENTAENAAENTAEAPAEADERLRRPARTRTFQLGELRVSYVADGAVGLKPRGWLPAATESDWVAYADHLDERGHLVASVGALLVEHGDRALLIDAGFGPRTSPDDPGNPLIGALRSGRLLGGLDRLGRAPEAIEAVAFTHLHGDHLGWAWNPAPGSSEPAFTRAAYLFGEPEWEQRHLAASHGATEEVLAVLAPKVRRLTDGEEVFPGVRALVRPGHTVGHVTYEITSGGERLLAFGDAMHSPVQVTHPEWSAAVDHDPGVAAEYRHWLVGELTEPGTLGFGIHFADVVFGRAERDSQGRTVWAPLP